MEGFAEHVKPSIFICIQISKLSSPSIISDIIKCLLVIAR